MSGGDLTIDDGEYCDRCPLADALDCMAVGPCERRRLAREIAGVRQAAIDLPAVSASLCLSGRVSEELTRMLIMEGEGVLVIGRGFDIVGLLREEWQAIMDDGAVKAVIIEARSGSIAGLLDIHDIVETFAREAKRAPAELSRARSDEAGRPDEEEAPVKPFKPILIGPYIINRLIDEGLLRDAIIDHETGRVIGGTTEAGDVVLYPDPPPAEIDGVTFYYS